MKIAFVSLGDAEDRNTWSGTTYYLFENLKKYHEVINLSPINNSNIVIKVIYKLLTIITKKKYLHDRNKFVVWKNAQEIKSKLKKYKDIDLIFSVGALAIADLKTDIPIYFYTDATFSGMINYYEEFSNLSNLTIKEGNMAEKNALEKSKGTFYSSDWASDSAIKFYGIEKNKIHTIPFGLNMDIIPEKQIILDSILKKINFEKLKLLFIGKDFKRKGGEIAVQTLIELKNKYGIDAELTIIGCNPHIENEAIKIIPYIDKNKKEEQKKYEDILKETHFLILPTKADCTPMVSVEANSYGIPTIISKTGGIPTIIKNKVNGILISNYSTSEEFVKTIKENFEDKKKYEKLALNTREYFEKNLTWDKSIEKINKVIIK